MMLNNRPLSASCYEIGYAPRADEEIAYIDDVEDDLITDDMSTAMSISQRSSVVTADSGRASSQSTLKSPQKHGVTKRSSKKMVGCRVALLDGTTFEPKGVDKGAMGQVLFEKVTKHLDIIETDYFGLTYRDKTGKKYWLDVTKKISKQVNGGTWVFEFQVKFYTPDPMSLKEDITRYQLCLQLRVDIFNGKLPCSFATYALLGSYTVQSELGDWDPVEFGTGIEYLHDFDFAPTQNAELLEKIAELHKHHKGLTPTMSEAHFLENAKKLAMFGVDLHDAKDSENKDLQLGICANGILVYKDRLRINRFVWPKILKLSYKRNNFYVKVRPGEFEPHERTIMFRLENHKLAKRVWKTCVEHHAFFRLKETDPHNTDTLFPRFNTRFRYSGRTAHQARKAAEQVQRDEPHIARTAERRSLGHGDHRGNRGLEDGTMTKKPGDESDKYDKKHDPNATANMGANDSAALQDGKYRQAPSDVKANYMQMLAEKPDITSQTPWAKAQPFIQEDPRYFAVPSDDLREQWYDEYQQNLIKANYMQMLAEKPFITSQTRWSEAQPYIQEEKPYLAVPSDDLREKWFDEYIQNLIKMEYMQLLHDTPSVTSTTPWVDAQHDIYHDPRYQAVPTDAQRQDWYDEYQQNLLKNEFMRMLQDSPAITSNTKWSDAKRELQSDPRYKNVPNDDQREQWFNEYVQGLGPPPYSPGDGKKDKKAKEEEKRRKKEEEQRRKEEEKRRKEEEKERKRLEKEKKKQKGKPAETNLDGDQEEQKKENRRSGGFFGLFRRSTKEKPEKKEEEEVVAPHVAAKEEEEAEEEFVEQKPKPIQTWALPGMQELMIKKKAEPEPESEPEQEEKEEEKVEETPPVPRIEIQEAPPVSDSEEEETTKTEEPVTQEHQTEIQSEPVPEPVPEPVCEQVPEPVVPEPEIEVQSETTQVESSIEVKEESFEAQDDDDPDAAVKAEAAVIVKDVIEKAVEVVAAESTPQAEEEELPPAPVEEEVKLEEVTIEESTQELPLPELPAPEPVSEEEARVAAWLDFYQLKEDFTQLLRETPEVTSQSRLEDVKHKIGNDPRYKAVGNDAKREKWFNDYTDKMLKDDFMRLLMETPTICAQTPWADARREVDLDPRYLAVNSDAKREEWFNEYVQNLLKQDYMQLLKDTPSIHSQSRFEPVRAYIENDPRYAAVENDAKREAWFDEYIQNLKKEEFMDLLRETPDITSYSRYPEVRSEICNDQRFANVDTEQQREEYFDEYTTDLKKAGFTQLLQDTPDITAYSKWHDSKSKIDTDPRYHAAGNDVYRSVWFNQYVNRLAGIGCGDGDFGLRVGDYKSIDRKQEFEPIAPPTQTTRKSPEETMPFFEPVDNDAKKRMPPPIAKKPRVASGYDSEEDRLLKNAGGVYQNAYKSKLKMFEDMQQEQPVTVETETFKYNPDNEDLPKATSNIPIVETKTQKVTYEKDGIPYETEDSILISAHSVTNKSQTIDTTTYKTERDGVVETRVERKITVMTDGDTELDHDALLRAAIEQVTNMNQSFEVEKIEYMRQIEDK